jgi:hypothetical protein
VVLFLLIGAHSIPIGSSVGGDIFLKVFKLESALLDKMAGGKFSHWSKIQQKTK